MIGDDDNGTASTKAVTRTEPATATTAPKSAPSGLSRLAALFKTDPVKEEAGTWMPVADGVEIRVRSQQSETARTVSKRLLQRYRAALAVGASLSPEQNKEFELALCAEALVVEWKGMDDAGSPIACTDTAVLSIFGELPHLRRQVLAYSDSLENYRPDPI